jgi:hypothetical protein
MKRTAWQFTPICRRFGKGSKCAVRGLLPRAAQTSRLKILLTCRPRRAADMGKGLADTVQRGRCGGVHDRDAPKWDRPALAAKAVAMPLSMSKINPAIGVG